MIISKGDILEMKKPHPCGSKNWLVIRDGVELRLCCMGCGHELLIARAKIIKNVRSVKRPET